MITDLLNPGTYEIHLSSEMMIRAFGPPQSQLIYKECAHFARSGPEIVITSFL